MSSAATFEDFVDANAGALLRMACLITWDDAEAEDLVQECLLRVAGRWPRVSSMEMPVAYARRVLINLAVAGSRRRIRRRAELSAASYLDSSQSEAGVDGVDPSAEIAFAGLGDRAELFSALAQLSPQQRLILVLRYFEDLSEEQVAQTLGCSVGTVKSSASRGLGRLRKLVPHPMSTTEVTEK